MKWLVLALFAIVVTVAIGFASVSARADERSHANQSCRTVAHRTCGANDDTQGDTHRRHDAAIEAAVSTNVGGSGPLALTSATNLTGSASLTPRRGPMAAFVMFKRPHDPRHLHPYSLLI